MSDYDQDIAAAEALHGELCKALLATLDLFKDRASTREMSDALEVVWGTCELKFT